MAIYKLSQTGVFHIPTGRDIPKDNTNRDYVEFLRWVIDGNTPDSADPESIPDTDQQKVARTLQNDPVFKALIKVLATRLGVTATQLINEIKAQV